MSVDLINRDPNGLNHYVQVEYEDVLAEPLGAHSAQCVWENSHTCFRCGRNLCYKILTYLCGICIALYWGCTFACLAFEAIWCCTPSIRALHICLHPIKKIYAITLGAFLAPMMETLGLLFSRIHVTNSTGEPPKPLDVIGVEMSAPVKNFR